MSLAVAQVCLQTLFTSDNLIHFQVVFFVGSWKAKIRIVAAGPEFVSGHHEKDQIRGFVEEIVHPRVLERDGHLEGNMTRFYH